jgi:hypothetical protein
VRQRNRNRASAAAARVRVNALGVPQSPPHSRNESVRLWRLLEGPVSASLPNSLELTPERCSGSAALSSRTRLHCEAGQTVAAGGSIQNGPRRLRPIKGLQWQTLVRGDIGRQRLFAPVANRPRSITDILGHNSNSSLWSLYH